jgi:transposase-like protein
MSYHEDLEIDEYHLLEEWKTQADLFMSYCEETAGAQEAVDAMKDSIDAREAKVELEIRQGIYSLMPEGIKVVDKTIVALVNSDPEVQKLKAEYITLKKEAYILKKVEQAFEQRKKALENMVVLSGREQYSEPVDRTQTIETQSYEAQKRKIDEKLKR